MAEELTLRDTRRILHDWGGLARTGAGPAELLHGYPTRNPIDRMRQSSGPGGPDDWNPTPTEAAVSRVEGWKGDAARVHALLHGLPLIPAMCIAAHYRDRQDPDATATLLGTSRRSVFEQRQRGEESIMRALNLAHTAPESLPRKAA